MAGGNFSPRLVSLFIVSAPPISQSPGLLFGERSLGGRSGHRILVLRLDLWAGRADIRPHGVGKERKILPKHGSQGSSPGVVGLWV